MAPNTGKRREKGVEGGDELDAQHGVGSSAHLTLEKNTVLTAGTASRRSTRLSSIGLLERLDASSAAGERVFHAVIALAHFERQHLFECPRDGIVETRKEMQDSRLRDHQSAFPALRVILRTNLAMTPTRKDRRLRSKSRPIYGFSPQRPSMFQKHGGNGWAAFAPMRSQDAEGLSGCCRTRPRDRRAR